jgi:hypothetical protein
LFRQSMRLLPALVLLCLALAALSGPRGASAEDQKAQAPQKAHFSYPGDRVVMKQIRRYRARTWRWQRLMGMRRTRASHLVETVPSPTFKLWVRNLWRKRALQARRKATHPPHHAGWLCIHRYEGAWTDPDAPYYGGLQMDLGFQRTYGRDLLRRKGTADRWTPLEQMWVAERAHRSGRGYYPWPNTARYCGLI